MHKWIEKLNKAGPVKRHGSPSVSLTEEAFNALYEVHQQTGKSLRIVASALILVGKEAWDKAKKS